MRNSQPDSRSDDAQDAQDDAQTLRHLMSSLLASDPAPTPVLSDDELVAEVRRAAAVSDPE